MTTIVPEPETSAPHKKVGASPGGTSKNRNNLEKKQSTFYSIRAGRAFISLFMSNARNDFTAREVNICLDGRPVLYCFSHFSITELWMDCARSMQNRNTVPEGIPVTALYNSSLPENRDWKSYAKHDIH